MHLIIHIHICIISWKFDKKILVSYNWFLSYSKQYHKTFKHVKSVMVDIYVFLIFTHFKTFCFISLRTWKFHLFNISKLGIGGHVIFCLIFYYLQKELWFIPQYFIYTFCNQAMFHQLLSDIMNVIFSQIFLFWS